MVRNEDDGRQAEVIWTCHEERTVVCRKKSDGKMELLEKRKRKPKRRFLNVVKEDIGEVDEGRRTLKKRICEEHHMLWQPLIKEKSQKKKNVIISLIKFIKWKVEC